MTTPVRAPIRLPRLARVATLLLLLVSWAASAACAGDRAPRPLAFEPNRGQADGRVRYLARGAGYTVFLTSTEAVVVTGRGPTERAVVRVTPVGANADARIEADDALPGVVTYAGAAGRGSIDAPTYGRVRYAGVYPGVDLVYYGRPRQLEYDFVVAPGADPARIALAFEGVERIAIDDAGDLVLHTVAGELRQPRPVVYQDVDGERRPVAGDYAIDGDGHVRMKLGAYDASRPLVIDPVLAYATYLGGSDEETPNLAGPAFGIAVDAAGNTYVTGTTLSADFPTTPGAVQRTLAGTQDAFVTKLSPTGAVLYSTYLGGPCDDRANAIAVDAAGNAYITGRAHGTCYFEDLDSGVLVAKLSPTGALLYASVWSGGLVDISQGTAIAVDAAGHAYVTGSTASPGFPTTPGAFRTESCPDIEINAGFTDGFVMKLSPDGQSIVWSTFLCGDSPDVPSAIALDAQGHVVVAGTTGSSDFPVVGGLQPTSHTYPWGSTGFVTKLAADGSHLVWSTYVGGSTFDAIGGLALDAQGNAYVAGATWSTDFPTTTGTVQPQRNHDVICQAQPCSDAFVTKIAAAGSAIVWSTYLYGEGDDGASGIAVDATGHAHVVGTTSSLYFPVLDAFQAGTKVRGPSDAFVAKLSPDGARIVYSSYLGGTGGESPSTGGDEGAAIALDAAGNAHVAGFTKSLDFPATPGAFQRTLGGGVCDYFGGPCGDAFVATIAAAGPGAATATSVTVTPSDVAPGGLVTATWRGVPIPSADDWLILYPLGGGSEEYVAYWPTGGAAAGTMTLTLPALAPGTYEIRLMSPDPEFYGLLEAAMRSGPIRVGTPAADLVVTGIATTPAQPTAGQPVAIAVSVTNQGAAAAGAFAVDVYTSRATAPAPGAAGDARCTIAALAAGASAQCTATVTYATAGTFTAWAQADTLQAVAESDETNNALGPRPIAIAASAPDLIVAAIGNPPASAAPGKALAIASTIRNQGATAAAPSTARFYLSLDGARSADDTPLTGTRAIAALAAGAQSAGTTTVTIPDAIAAGVYRVLACADDPNVVAEASEANNCAASAATITVGRPDLAETAVSNPPAAARPGSAFAVTDTVRNAGTLAAAASTTRYYLSADAQRSADDRLLTGSRAVAALAAGAASTQTVTVTIPAATPLGTYRLLACADDARVVAEDDETNNCVASAGTIVVALPDLVEQALGVPAGAFKRGTRFTVSDTAANAGRVATTAPSTTKFYLSLDGAKSAGDVLLTGTRAVPILGASATSTGSTSVTIPPTATPGAYYVLACADDAKSIAEADETNNCRASATTVTVTP